VESARERLYPVLDDLLASWMAHVRLPFEGIRIVGSQWSPASYATREFLSLNQVPYQWVDIEKDAPTRELVAALRHRHATSAIILLPDGTHLVAPSHLELAARIGLQTDAARPFYDVVIIGGGPAGLANAVYAASEGTQDAARRTKRARRSGGHQLDDRELPRLSRLASPGADLASRAVAQARRFGAELLVGMRSPEFAATIRTGSSRSPTDGSLVLRRGSRDGNGGSDARGAGIDRLLGAGVYYGAAMSEGALYRDRDIAIVGGANFRRTGRDVLFPLRAQGDDGHRAAGLSPAMSRYLVDRINDAPNVEVVTRAEVVAVAAIRTSNRSRSGTSTPPSSRRSTWTRCSSSSAWRHARRASPAWWRWTTRASSSPARPISRVAAQLAARTRSDDVRNEHPGCSPPATRAPAPIRRVAAAVGEAQRDLLVHKYLETL
jgi:thioredoxin reductase (NADPH)